MPRNHGHTALLANWTVHSKIRTILKILTILSILQSSLSQERSNKDNDKDYVVEWDDAYGLPARLSIFVKGDDNETSDTSLSKETLEGSKERRYSRWWKEEEEKSRREEDLWRKDVNKAGLMALEVNTVKRTIGQEYLDWRSFKERTIEGMEDVKENEENERTKERGDNEESSRSKEDRNSNNFMTKPGTPRNRETDGDWVEERSKGGRSSWILRGASIKRSIREDATRGEVFRKDEMSFSTASELDDDLRRTEGEKRRRRRRERKRRRRETNSSFELDEWKASNRSVLEKRKVRINVKEKKSLRGEVEETKKEKEIKTDEKEEDTKFITTISSRDEWQEEKGWIERLRKKNRNVVESFGENLWERDEKSNASLGTIVDNFSEDTTLSYLSKKVRKSTQRKEDAPNRVGSSKDSEIPSWYRDNTPLAGKAIGFRSRKETEDKNRMTTRRGNLSRDKVQKEQTNVDLKPREKNVLVTTQRSRLGTERLSKEFSNSPELATVPSGTIKYMKRDENWIARSGISDGNESFSTTTTATLLKNVSQGKENEKDRDDRGGEILSTTPIYFSRGQKEKNSAKDMKDGKEGVSRSVGNISENTGVYRNSTYPNHDTFDSSWVYSTGLPIVESNGREAVVESSKDSERNVGDSVESSESPKLFETSPLPRFPIVSIVRDRELVKENSRREHHGVVQNREKVQRYKEDEKLVKTLSKKYQGVTPNTRDSRIDKKKAEENTTETISPEYFPRSTSLTNSEITSSSWMIEVKEEESAQKAEDRKVSDYEKEINDTARDPLKEYKFELRESTVEFDATSAVSPTTLDDIREKLERNYGREEKDRKVERLKEEESLNPTILSKSKRSKSIKITSKYSIPSGRTKEDEKSGVGNQETKTDESFDPISNSHENVRTSVLRRNTTETTVETSVERTSTNGPLDRSISFTGVEIEGITNTPPLFDVSSQFPFDLFNTIVSTSIGENVSLSDITERSTIPWEETTTYNVSSKQPIGSTPNTTNLDQWPVKHSAVVEGDLVLGGLMMVHEREDTITCGPVMPQGGVQALEAMLYTLDTLNQREIVPGVKIGAHILDDCDKDTYGLEMAVDFIKDTTRVDLPETVNDKLKSDKPPTISRRTIVKNENRVMVHDFKDPTFL